MRTKKLDKLFKKAKKFFDEVTKVFFELEETSRGAHLATMAWLAGLLIKYSEDSADQAEEPEDKQFIKEVFETFLRTSDEAEARMHSLILKWFGPEAEKWKLRYIS